MCSLYTASVRACGVTERESPVYGHEYLEAMVTVIYCMMLGSADVCFIGSCPGLCVSYF